MKKIIIKFLALASYLFLLCIPALAQQPDNNPWINVSHSRGVPLGGLGNGYSMFGKYGFIKVNFNGRPDHVKYGYGVPESVWGYTIAPAEKDIAQFGFSLKVDNKTYVLQQTKAKWLPNALPFDTVEAYAYLPKSRFVFGSKSAGVNVSIQAFTPLIQHDVTTSTTPVQVFDVTLENSENDHKEIQFSLENAVAGTPNANKIVFTDENGQIAFAANGGIATEKGVSVKLTLKSNSKKTIRYYIAWYYPAFKHITPDKRYYSTLFENATEVINLSVKSSDKWLSRIDEWHNSLDVPVYLKRLWFSSLSSVITSTMLGEERSFYEIETPHSFLNTMDVVCYSSWAYLVNWPEIEKKDMDQYTTIIEKEGKMAGFVWHSMIKDKSSYVEEPCYLTRMYRDYLWYNDKNWLTQQYPFAILAANRVYNTDGLGYLINSDHGNQSYDLWKMPGISAYINSAWIYGLHGLNKMAEAMGTSASVKDIPAIRLQQLAVNSFDSLLWNPNPGYFNCFYRTPTAENEGEPTSIFSDQLFGKWMLAIDRGSNNILLPSKVKQSLGTIYKHNLIEDEKKNFRGWANGLKPGRIIDKTGYHAYMFWFGAQFNLASLLSLSGDEEASLDVMKSVEKSLNNNHLAAGEWNKSFDDSLNIRTLPKEPAKDTPRFPAYPRYKSGWEYLIRMIGLQMDEQYFYLQPFKTLDFSIKNTELAGTQFSITVQKNWSKVIVDGKVVDSLPTIPRNTKKCTLNFIK